MKQSEIDRWMRRQARRDGNRTLPAVNWVLVVTVIIMGIAGLYLVLKLVHTV